MKNSDSVWQGQRVRLRAVEPSDGEAHFAWNHDSEMARQVDRVWFPQSRAATDRWVEQTSLADAQGDNFVFEIENLSGVHVGIINTHGCDPRNGTFAYGVVIRAEHQRQGYASDAIRVVLRHYFDELRYQKATVRVYSFNDASIQLAARTPGLPTGGPPAPHGLHAGAILRRACLRTDERRVRRVARRVLLKSRRRLWL